MYVWMYASMYVFDLSVLRVHNCKFVLRQDGAGGARWADNPEVGRSKLSPAQSFYVNF